MRYPSEMCQYCIGTIERVNHPQVYLWSELWVLVVIGSSVLMGDLLKLLHCFCK